MRNTVRERDDSEALLRRMVARRRRDNAIVAILAVLAVLGGGNALHGFFTPAPPGPSDDSTTALIGRAQLAGSFAEQFVVSYLSANTAQREKLGEYAAVGQVALPSSGRPVADPAVVYVARTISGGGLDVWSVTVSVRHGARTGAAAAGEPRQYYRVAVSTAAGRLRALAPPALVQPPARGADLSLAYGAPCGQETPLHQVAAGFLAAMLAGSGDIARYTQPGSAIAAVQPAPFSAAEVTAVDSDDRSCGAESARARLSVQVTPKVDGAAAATLVYPLTLVRTGGQWQVASVDPIPALTEPLTVVTGGEAGQAGPAGPANASTAPATTTARIPPPTQN
ncbi:conjugal transfer protein [Nocardia asteroides]|uniref:conjugal transfer protein n=1 Tax=Nocardia asteroides TaxID=1824 RepID=UPI001E45E9D4|nr:conjugal transfer protein [Nocardia asteroides]UGT63368.1 conjugal transfer protein [Nocardia asteroides]